MDERRELRRWANTLKEILKERGRTQRWVEERVGWARGYLSQLLSPQSPDLKAIHLLRVLDAIELPPEEFFARVYGPESDSAGRSEDRHGEVRLRELSAKLLKEVRSAVEDEGRRIEARLAIALQRNVDRAPGRRAQRPVAGVSPAAQLRELLSLPAEARDRRVKREADLQTEELARLAAKESLEAVFDDPRRSRDLAAIGRTLAARLLATSVREQAGLRTLRAYLEAVYGNALRLLGELKAATRAFEEARRLLGPSPEGTLETVEIDNLEVSLRRDLRDFDTALELSERAVRGYLDGGRHGSAAKAMVKRATVFEILDDQAKNIATLREASGMVEIEDDPWIALTVRHTLIVGLAREGRCQEAEAVFGESLDLYEQFPAPGVAARRLWAEGLMSQGRGDFEKATQELDCARAMFMDHGYAMDAALVSLDLAAVLSDLGRNRDVQAAAASAYALLDAQGVHPDALVALTQFQQAASRETLTRELVRQVARRVAHASASLSISGRLRRIDERAPEPASGWGIDAQVSGQRSGGADGLPSVAGVASPAEAPSIDRRDDEALLDELLRVPSSDSELLAWLDRQGRDHALRVADEALKRARGAVHAGARRTLELAMLGRSIARAADENQTEERTRHLRAYAEAVVGNALRLVGDYRTAAESFAEARRHLAGGAEESSTALEIDNLEVSFLRDVRDYSAALELSDRTIRRYLDAGWIGSAAKALLTRATIFELMDDQEKNISTLQEAARLSESAPDALR